MAAARSAARRALPVVYDETFLRSRLRIYLPDDPALPGEKFYALPHDTIAQFSLFFLEAIKQGLVPAGPLKIGIPTSAGLLAGEIIQGPILALPQPPAFLMARNSKSQMGVKRLPISHYGQHVLVNNFVDYDGLGARKERAYDILHLIEQMDIAAYAVSAIYAEYLGLKLAHYDSANLAKTLREKLGKAVSVERAKEIVEAADHTSPQQIMGVFAELGAMAQALTENLDWRRRRDVRAGAGKDVAKPAPANGVPRALMTPSM